MIEMLAGRYFYPNAARSVPATASVPERRLLRISDETGAVLSEAPSRGVKVTARLARLTRRFDLPDGARFETDDNDGADALLRRLGKFRRGRFTDRLERAWPVVGLALVVTLLAGFYFVVQVVPFASEWLALRLLPEVAHSMSEQTLMGLDRAALKPTALSAADQAKVSALFAKTAAHAKSGRSGYRLVFRGGGVIGPNAFALPDGTIVMTDEIWKAVKADGEIEGVFAHEMSHVDHAHGLQEVIQAALIPAALAIFTGDMSQIGQMSAILPGIVLSASYSRSFEQQADDDAAATMRRMGEKPSRMADLLERLEAKECGKKGCGRSWVGDHPATELRVMRLRAEDKGPIRDAVQDCLRPWKAGFSPSCLGFK
jgi:Zn-dependent protease with chaperone function